MLSRRKSNPVGLGCMLIIVIILALAYLSFFLD